MSFKPKTGSQENTSSLNVQVPRKMKEDLRVVADAYGLSISALARQMFDHCIEDAKANLAESDSTPAQGGGG